MKKNRIKTKETLKNEIIEYLQDATEKGDWKLEDSTLSSISEHVHEEKERVDRVLDELEGEDKGVVKAIKIETKVYLPKTARGETIAKELAKKKLIMPLSPYAAFIIAIIILYIAAPYTVSNASAVQDGLLLALIFSVVLALILQWAFGEFVNWKATSKETYEDVVRISKFSVGLFLLFFVVYYGLTKLIESKITPEGIITVFFGAIAVAFSYVAWRRGK